MIKFSKEIMERVYKLRQLYETQKNNYVEASYPIIEIKKIFKEHELFIRMVYDSKAGTFELQAPTYQFCSKISHFDYNKPESRWTRDKGFLFSLIHHLKDSGFWNMISNQDFLVVNSFNEKINPGEAKKLWKILKTVKEV
jgi:hypothetical protein